MKSISKKGKVFCLVLLIGAVCIPVLNAGVISVPPIAARADEQEGFTWFADMTQFYVDGFQYNPSPDVYIPVNLPNGVSIKKFIAILTDETADLRYPIDVELVRVNLATGNMDYMGGVNSAKGHALDRKELTTTNISYRTVDNTRFAYAVYITEWYPTIDRKFHGAKIYY